MASQKKRINVSLDIETYNSLQNIKNMYGFKSCPEMLVAFAHVFLDCVKDADGRRMQIEANDRAYIAQMFNMFTNDTVQPCGVVPKKGYTVHIDSDVWQKTKNTED